MQPIPLPPPQEIVEAAAYKESTLASVITTASYLLDGVRAIHAEPRVPADADDNHFISIRTDSGVEKISILALSKNGERKSYDELLSDLVGKIRNHLENKTKGYFLLPSGAMINLGRVKLPISVENGYFCVDGRIVVVKSDLGYTPLQAERMHTYTLFHATLDGDLLILGDEEGDKGFIFNLKKPMRLDKSAMCLHPNDSQFHHLPDVGDYIVLHRSRDDART